MEGTPITIARGDGIGPEIMQATLTILDGACAKLDYHEVEIGEKVYLSGHKTGVTTSTLETIRKTKAFLKAPIKTPQGGGFTSLNVTIRSMFGLFANVRPCRAYFPFVDTHHPDMDIVVIRENEEDLYCGIEYQQSPDVCTAIKLISETGSEKITRFAFEYAKRNGRKKVTCFVKDNIMKLSDGLFHKVFDRVAKEYPEIEHDHWIIDIGAAKLAHTPEMFDVVVMPNLYGDILSDVGAQVAGSVGLAGSANIGEHGAMFEAIHGSAPRIAGENRANPSALILASVLLLIHIGHTQEATTIHNAWLSTIEEGVHTYDIFKEGTSKEKVGTQEFASAVVDRLGRMPKQLKPVCYNSTSPKGRFPSLARRKEGLRKLVGVDLYVYAKKSLDLFEKEVSRQDFKPFELDMITNRGAQVYPNGARETFCVDQWRIRLMSSDKCTQRSIVDLLKKVAESGWDIIKTENLYTFDGEPGYSSAKR